MSSVGRRVAAGVGRVAGQVAAAGRAAGGHRVVRRVGLVAALVVVTLAGLGIGIVVAGPAHSDVGPFSAQFGLEVSASGGSEVQLPPLGSMEFASNAGPARLVVRLDSLDQTRTLALASAPGGLATASRDATNGVRSGVVRLVERAVVGGLAGVVVVAAAVFRRWRRVALCAVLGALVLAGAGASAAATFRPASIAEPTYHGLLTNVPAVVGDAQQIADQFGKYRDQLQRLVDNTNKLYAAVSSLPAYQPAPGSIRVLHVSDLHLNPVAWPLVATVVRQYAIDLVIDTGDINDWGSPPESTYVEAIRSLGVPYVYIRGNHDSATTAAAVAAQPDAVVLEDQVATVAGLTIAGIGDPRFTPDKQPNGPAGAGADQAAQAVRAAGRQLAATIRAADKPVDIALVHDPASAGALAGVVPLVLAGHTHARRVSLLGDGDGDGDGQDRTRLMVEGSTGGAGLRGLEGKEPTPLEMSILYFGPQRVLRAYDEVTVGGTGQTEVTVKRNIVGADAASASPSGSGAPSEQASPVASASPSGAALPGGSPPPSR